MSPAAVQAFGVGVILVALVMAFGWVTVPLLVGVMIVLVGVALEQRARRGVTTGRR